MKVAIDNVEGPWKVTNAFGDEVSRHWSAYAAVCRAMSEAADGRENCRALHTGRRPFLAYEIIAYLISPGGSAGSIIYRNGTSEKVKLPVPTERDEG